MSSSKLISSFLLLLILFHATNSIALTPQAEEKREVEDAGDGVNPLKLDKEVSGAVMANEVSDKRLKGRKMMAKETKEEGIEVKERKISGAGFVVGNYYKKWIRSHPLKQKRVGFTAFSADYHLPKSHPSKHN